MHVEQIDNLKKGDIVAVTDPANRSDTFEVFVGDALLNGDDDQAWMRTTREEGTQYIRKLPENGNFRGAALFYSLEELKKALKAGEFYIGA